LLELLKAIAAVDEDPWSAAGRPTLAKIGAPHILHTRSLPEPSLGQVTGRKQARLAAQRSD
jgi:hypothetical protein